MARDFCYPRLVVVTFQPDLVITQLISIRLCVVGEMVQNSQRLYSFTFKAVIVYSRIYLFTFNN